MGLRQIQDPYYHGFAAQISFYLMLSVVPIFFLLIQILGLFDINTETAIEMVEQYTGQHMSGLLESIFEFNYIGFGNIIFLVIALWAGSRASFCIARITNYTMTEGENTGKNYFAERFRAIITMFLTLLALVIAMVILCYGKLILTALLAIFKVDDVSEADKFWMWMRWPLGFILYFLVIGYNYYILPTVKRPFKRIIPGAIFASLGLLIVSYGYSFYTGTLVNYDITYGALSSVVAIMIWFLLLSWVIILGVMCNKVFESTSKPFSKSRPPEHLNISEAERKARENVQNGQSRFDIDPDEVNITTIKGIIMGSGQNMDAQERQQQERQQQEKEEQAPAGGDRDNQQ